MRRNKVKEDLRKLRNRIDDLGEYVSFKDRKEIKRLSERMVEGETLYSLGEGTFRGSNKFIALTDRRLIFMDIGLFGKLDIEEILLTEIDSFEYILRNLYGSIYIKVAGEELEISYMVKKYVELMGNCIEDLLEEKFAKALPSSSLEDEESLEIVESLERVGESIDYSENLPFEDIAKQLRELGELRDMGLLTEREFKKLKQRII